MPATYLLWTDEEHAESTGVNPALRRSLHILDERSRAVVRLLRELSRDEDFEVFLTRMDVSDAMSGARNARGEDHLTHVSSYRDYVDIITGQPLLSDFKMPRQDILEPSHPERTVVRLLFFAAWPVYGIG